MDVGPRDLAVIAGELGRTPRDITGVAARCPFGYPAVTESAPVLGDGAPNPTLLYLTCPALAAAVDRVEAAGGVKALKAACERDRLLLDLLQTITGSYRERRSALMEQVARPVRIDPRLGAGIGGPETPEKASCLHAYAAALLAVTSGWLAPGDSRAVEEAQKAWARLLPPLEETWCTDARCARWDTAQRRAAIDVGTISVRLLVADLADGRPWPVVRKAEVTRLGEGLRLSGRFSEVARERTAAVVERFAAEARTHGVERIVLAGTSATRDACDGKEFITTLGSEFDLEAAVLSGEREAALSHVGACLDVKGDPVVLDVGGGSSELTVRLGSGRVWPASLELGAGRCTESHLHSDPPTQSELESLREHATGLFAALRPRFGVEAVELELSDDIDLDELWLDGSGPDEGGPVEDRPAVSEPDEGAPDASGASGQPWRRLVGVAGTVTTLAAMDAGLQRYCADAIHLRTLSLDAVRGLVDRLAALSTKERAALPCMQPGRAPVIVAGAVIVMAAMEALGYTELTVSERDLLDGLVLRGAC